MEGVVCRVRPLSAEVEPRMLVYPHGTLELLTCCTMWPLPPDNRFYELDVVDMCDKAVIGCSQEWLILRGTDDGTTFSLFNPLTSEAMHLPPLDSVSNTDLVDLCTIGWTQDSTLADADADTDNVHVPCVVYLFFASRDLLCSCRLTQRSWVAHRFEPLVEKTTRMITLNANVLLNGGCKDTQMVLFGTARGNWESTYFTATVEGVVDDTLKLTPLQIPDLHFDMDYHYGGKYYIESCGRLYCVYLFIDNALDQKIVAIKVGELDLPGNKWKEIESLDGRAFFLIGSGGSYSTDANTWCWADTDTSIGRVKESCLYFCHPLKSGETLYEYNMLDQSLTSFCPCPNLASSHSQPLWLMPPKNRSNTRGLAFCEQRGREDVAIVKENKEKEDEEHEGANKESRLMELLSFDMIENMSKYLHLFDFWSFRATCRVFRSAAHPAPSWRTHNMFPLFMFIKNNAGLCSLMDPFRHDSHSSTLQQLLPQPTFKVVFSNNGWILTAAGRRTLHFLNPLTGQSGEFPEAKELADCSSFAFSTCPTSSECVTVGLYRFGSVLLIFYYMKQGDENWSTWDFYHEPDFEFKPTTTTAPVFYKSSFYFLDANGYLGQFSLVNGQPDWQILNKEDTIFTEFDSSFLVEWDGKLCSVFIGLKGRGVKVLEFDNSSDKKWREIKDLGDHALFLSSASCFSIATSNVDIRNRIYLPRLKGEGMVFYSMETCMYHVSGSDEFTSDLYYTKQPMKCCWF